MTKARILANLISDNAELADGQISVAEVVGAAPLASPTFTGTVTTDAVTMNGYLTVNGAGVDVNTVIYPNGIAMEDSRAISFGTGADFELSSGGTFLDHNLKDNARHLRIINGLTEHHRFSGDGNVIFNNSGADADFRIETDNETHAIFVDAGNDRVGLFASSTASGYALTVGTGGIHLDPDVISRITGTRGYSVATAGGINVFRACTVSGVGSRGRLRAIGSIGYGDPKFVEYFVEMGEGNAGDEFGVNVYSVGNPYGQDAFQANNNQFKVYTNRVDSTTFDLWVEVGHFCRMEFFLEEVGGVTPRFDNSGTSTLPGTAILTNNSSQVQIVADTVQLRTQNASQNTLFKNLKATSSETVLNDDSQDINFRVESDNSTHALFVNAGDDKVSINTGSTHGTLTIEHNLDNSSDWWTNAKGVLYLANTNASGMTAIKLNNANDTRASLVFNTSGTGRFQLFDRTSTQERLGITASETIINEDSANADFRVESDSNTSAIFVDAALNRVGIFASGGENNFNVNAQGTSSHSSGTMPPGMTMYSNGSGDGTGNAIMFKNSTGAQGLSGIGSFRTGANGGYGRDLRFYTNDAVGTNAYKEKMRIAENGAIYGPSAYNGGFITAEISQSHLGNDATGTADITFTVNLKNTSGTYDNWQLMMYLTTSGNSSPAKTSVYEIRGSQRSSAGSVNRTTLVSGESRTITSSVSGLAVTFTIASEGNSTATQGAKFCWLGGTYGCESVSVGDSA